MLEVIHIIEVGKRWNRQFGLRYRCWANLPQSELVEQIIPSMIMNCLAQV